MSPRFTVLPTGAQADLKVCATLPTQVNRGLGRGLGRHGFCRQDFFGACDVLWPHEKIDAAHPELRPGSAAIVRSDHRFDACGFERAVRKLGVDAREVGAEHDKIRHGALRLRL